MYIKEMCGFRYTITNIKVNHLVSAEHLHSWKKVNTLPDVKNHVPQRNLSLANILYFRDCKFLLHIFPFKVQCLLDVTIMPSLKRFQEYLYRGYKGWMSNIWVCHGYWGFQTLSQLKIRRDNQNEVIQASK